MHAAQIGGSIVARRQLGRELRQLRAELGRSRDDVVASGIVSLAKLARIEQGITSIRPGDVRELCVLYQTSPEVTEQLVEMARGTRHEEWWESSSTSIRHWFGMYLALEGVAGRIQAFQPSLVHGLFQTRDYATAVENFMPVSPALTQQYVAMRMERQRLVFSRPDPLKIDPILSEEALAIPFAPPQVVAEQIAHLKTASRREGIRIGILPLGSFPVGLGPFTVMDFPDQEDPSVIYVETYEAARYPEKLEQVSRFRALFEKISTLTVPLEEFLA